MLIPRYHRTEVSGSLYISGSFTKFIEQARMDWLPLELESEQSVAAVLELASGLLLPSSFEAYDSPEDAAWHREKTALVLAQVERINLARFFPVVAVGFGAQLLLAALSNHTLAPRYLPAAGLRAPLDWLDGGDSLFGATFPQPELRRAASYSFSSLYAFAAEEARGSASYAQNVRTLAEAALPARVLAVFEARARPYLGLLFDLNRAQFFRDETYDIAKDAASEDAAFAFALGVLRLMRRGNCTAEYAEVIKRQSLWAWASLAGFAGVFEDFYYV